MIQKCNYGNFITNTIAYFKWGWGGGDIMNLRVGHNLFAFVDQKMARDRPSSSPPRFVQCGSVSGEGDET
jgi:hypothetical protein